MPVVNGYDAAIEIKRYRTNLPIIAQTAFASSEEIKKCLEVGCDDYITKPFNPDELFKKLYFYLKQNNDISFKLSRFES